MDFKSRPLLTDEFILVDGVTRAGKFMLANVVASLERIEFFQYPHLLETVLYFHRLGKIDFYTARELLHLDFNMNTLNMAFGRALNSRKFDLSCIENSIDSEKYKRRAATEDRNLLLSEYKREKRIPFFINHEGLSNMDSLFRIFPKVKVLNALRDPITLIDSWYRRGWGSRIGNDFSVGWASFDYRGSPVPWWAVNWADEYLTVSEMDRCLKSIYTLVSMAKESFERAPNHYKERVLLIAFERIVVDPHAEIKRIEKFLDVKAMNGIAGVLKREKLPRPYDHKKTEVLYRQIKSMIEPKNYELFDQLVKEYEDFWCKL